MAQEADNEQVTVDVWVNAFWKECLILPPCWGKGSEGRVSCLFFLSLPSGWFCWGTCLCSSFSPFCLILFCLEVPRKQREMKVQRWRVKLCRMIKENDAAEYKFQKIKKRKGSLRDGKGKKHGDCNAK